MLRILLAIALLPLSVLWADDLADYRTPATAKTTTLTKTASGTTAASQPGYLGVQLGSTAAGRVVVAQVALGAPATGRLHPRDELVSCNGLVCTTAGEVQGQLQQLAPGAGVTLVVRRQGVEVGVLLTMGQISRPLAPASSARRAALGITTVAADAGVRIERVQEGSPAAAAGLRVGDIIVRLDDTTLTSAQLLSDALSNKQPGEDVALVVRRGIQELDVTVKLAAAPDPVRLRSWDDRPLSAWRKPVYRLAVVTIAFPDVAPNAQITPAAWTEALFSTGTYTNRSVTGQKVYGSLNDYYRAQSYGQFRVEGQVFAPVTVKQKRQEYSGVPSKPTLLTEALEAVLARDGAAALKGFDGVFFVYAGDRVPTTRGGIFWPHRSGVRFQGQSWSYFICPEGGNRMNSISVIAHEFGHMLGLPDLYARPENPGSEGVGVWCTMSNGHGSTGQPLSFSVWCKEQLGWIKPVVLDPRVPQKLLLGNVADQPNECYKVLIRPDGSEYLLLENRHASGWDRDLPAAGLLIWRVLDGKPYLEESHGVSGPAGPRVHLGSVPYPSGANNAFTPSTTPASTSPKGGGWPVHLTNIRKLADGRIALQIGYEYW